MKQLKLLVATFAFIGLLLFVSSCNQGDKKKGDDNSVKNDSTSAKPGNIMFIKYHVADYAKWLAVYDSQDSLRLAWGLHNYGLSRGTDDSNMVFVSLKMDDLTKARAFAALPDMKATIQKAGVEGEPVIMYYDRQMFDIATTKDLIRVMVSHRVKDWDAWKKEFEDQRQARMDAGLKDRSYGFEVGDNKMVYMIFTIEDLKKARDYFASNELRDKMKAEGVEGSPMIFFYKLVKKN